MAEEYISVLLSVYTNESTKKNPYLCFVSFIYVLCSHFVAQQHSRGWLQSCSARIHQCVHVLFFLGGVEGYSFWREAKDWQKEKWWTAVAKFLGQIENWDILFTRCIMLMRQDQQTHTHASVLFY